MADPNPSDAPPVLRHVSDYRARRAVEFPPLGEALDAIRKAFDLLAAEGVPLPADTRAWLAESAAVKARLPKPPA